MELWNNFLRIKKLLKKSRKTWKTSRKSSLWSSNLLPYFIFQFSPQKTVKKWRVSRKLTISLPLPILKILLNLRQLFAKKNILYLFCGFSCVEDQLIIIFWIYSIQAPFFGFGVRGKIFLSPRFFFYFSILHTQRNPLAWPSVETSVETTF